LKAVKDDLSRDLEAIGAIGSIARMLDIICRTTGMGYATVARVTAQRWVACAVHDNINFGLGVGGELKVETTLCHEVNQFRKPIVIDDFSIDPEYANHHTPAMYGLQSYISIPIILKDGRFFGTLCAIDPKPARINNEETIGMFNLYAELIALHLDNFEQLEITRANLLEEQQLAELREQFIAILGHDLRNPVGAVKNIGQLLKRGNLDEQKLHHFATILQNSSYRMIGLIDNIMDFARGRLGSGIQLNIELKDLTADLQHVVDELQLVWPNRQIVTRLTLDQPVQADSKRIAQLFSNLLGNALSHGSTEQPVSVSITQENQKFILSVANSGEPIPENALKELFHPFARGDKKAGQEGLGLGLYISSEIVKAHGGVLSVASNAQSTIFTVII
jgi:signal transduction histidine kinase